RANAAEAEAWSAFQEFHRRELDLTAKTRMAYFQLINADKQLELTRKNIALLKQFSEITRTKYEVGAQSQADVLQVETEQGKLEETVFDFQRQISDAQTQLNTLMNRPAQSPVALPAAGNFPTNEVSWEKIEAFALANRPELFIAQRKIEAAKARLELARRDWWPDPTFRIEADRYNQASQVASELIVGVSINMPWFNRKKYDAAIHENKKMLESAEHDLDAAHTETLGIVKNALKKVETFHHHSDLFRAKLIPLAQETLNSKRLNYETDKANFLDLLTAQRTLREVESMYWNHVTEYQIAVAELEALIGGKINFQNPTIEKTQEKK
ncbi:MAG: TolC family protein, partial [Verrucomicrobiota bacterium]